MFWWDIRHLVDPIEKLVLANSKIPNRRPLGAVRQIMHFFSMTKCCTYYQAPLCTACTAVSECQS